MDIIRPVKRECFKVNDHQRWLIALNSNTGMRLSEAAGLLTEDIKLNADTRYPARDTATTPVASFKDCI